MLEEMLKNHLVKKAELAIAKLDVEEIQERLNYANLVYVELVNECIEGEALQAPVISAVPPCTTNKFNSKTENVMLNYEPVHENRIDILQLKLDKASKERLIAPLQREVETVERLLIALSDKERFVIDLRYIRSYSVPETISKFAEVFRYGSKTTIERIEEEALLKMETIRKKKIA